MVLKKSKTYENLAKSFAGECQAQIRYKFIEYGARMQGHKTMAAKIDELVYNEFHHARMFYTMLQDGNKETIDNIDIATGYPFKEKWDLEENLRLAADDEKNEALRIYPEYMKKAAEEGFTEIAQLYKDIIEVEKQHYNILMELHNQMKSKTLYKKTKPVKWKCGDCGLIVVDKECWKECPLCKAKQGSALLILTGDN